MAGVYLVGIMPFDLNGPMIKETTEILLRIRNKITNDSDLVWTSFETADELRMEIDGFILRLNQGDKKVFKDIYIHFLPTSTFQEHSMQNGWTEEYLTLAERFDKIYKKQGRIGYRFFTSLFQKFFDKPGESS